MAAHLTPAQSKDLVERYRSGESADKIAAVFAISRFTVYKHLRKHGESVREQGLTESQVDEIVVRYHAGETQGEIAATFGVHQGTISKWLLKRGADIGRGEAMRRRLARMSPAERSALAAAAHDAVRGMERSPDDLIARARTREATQIGATAEELAIAARIAAAGETPIPQQSVGKYNLDVGVSPVAVELFGGGWHAHGAHRARLPQRVKDIADAGWNLLIAWTHDVHTLDVSVVANDALAYLERSRQDPAFRRQYRVIWGDGKLIAAGCVDDDKITLVPTGIRGSYARRR